jgi:uncharacterized protein
MAKSLRGFAAMDPAKQREIASRGGKAAHLKGTAHEFTPEEARVAGSKGGRASRRRTLTLVEEIRPQGTNAETVNPVNEEKIMDLPRVAGSF